MKTNLLSSLGFSLLAFASIGQMRQTGTPQRSITEGNPIQTTYEEYVAPRTEQSRPASGTIINRAACVDTLLYEDFQTKTIPASWQNLNLDGLTDANLRPTDWYIFVDIFNTTPGDTNYVAAASSWFSPAGTANNVLIMDAVAPCASTVMKWKSAPIEGPNYSDGYQIRVSTTGTNIADFTTTIFTAAENIGGGTQGPGNVHPAYSGNNGLLSEWEVNLGAYDNQTIYIAFFHNSTNDNLIMIDDIFVGSLVDFDLSVDEVSSEIYYSTPMTQVTPRTFTADISMTLGTSVTSPTSNVELFQGATSVFTNSPSAPSLTAGNNVILTTAPYTPLAIADYTAVFTASGVETDPDLTNNVDTLEFVVSDSVFATEFGVPNSSLGIGAGSPGYLGNQYNVVTTDHLTSITFQLNTPTIGDTVVGAIYDMTGQTPNAIIAMTDTLFVTSNTSAIYTLPIIGGGVELIPGSYIVGIKESTFALVSLSTNTNYYTPGNSWIYYNNSWGNNEDFGYLNTFVMRANFGQYCLSPVAQHTSSTSGLTATFTDASTDTDSWFWSFGDGNVSTQQSPTHTYAAAGTYTVCLIAMNACSSDTTCMPITVTQCVSPVASFTQVVNVGAVDFTNTSTSAANATYAWNFGDGQSSTLENPTNTFAANGSYAVCVTITDSCGSDTFCDSVTVATIGIEENNLIEQLSIYPIPAQEIMNIGNLISGEDFKVELLNNLGQVVKVIRTEGLETIQLDLSGIVDGYYHLRISNSMIIGTRAVLIKH